jgi:hypothetical protein
MGPVCRQRFLLTARSRWSSSCADDPAACPTDLSGANKTTSNTRHGSPRENGVRVARSRRSTVFIEAGSAQDSED